MKKLIGLIVVSLFWVCTAHATTVDRPAQGGIRVNTWNPWIAAEAASSDSSYASETEKACKKLVEQGMAISMISNGQYTCIPLEPVANTIEPEKPAQYPASYTQPQGAPAPIANETPAVRPQGSANPSTTYEQGEPAPGAKNTPADANSGNQFGSGDTEAKKVAQAPSAPPLSSPPTLNRIPEQAWQVGGWENQKKFDISAYIYSPDNPLFPGMTLKIQKQSYIYPIRLLPGKYVIEIRHYGHSKILERKEITVNPIKGNVFSQMANKYMDFVIVTK